VNKKFIFVPRVCGRGGRFETATENIIRMVEMMEKKQWFLIIISRKDV
jgi:hypothetical protein